MDACLERLNLKAGSSLGQNVSNDSFWYICIPDDDMVQWLLQRIKMITSVWLNHFQRLEQTLGVFPRAAEGGHIDEAHFLSWVSWWCP